MNFYSPYFNQCVQAMGSFRSSYSWGYVVSMLILGAAFGVIMRELMKSFASKKSAKPQNIGTTDRALRLVIAVALFIFAYYTNWNGWALAFSGYCFFEAMYSWCGFYAMMGKNTCSMG